ncbi:MAG: GNAT family N-acetyltransferase [Phreatobacter sp.]|nr:GNAT family N-acetyltransferase [Phreatobacter sp.]
MPPLLESDRLLLRPRTEADVEDYVAMDSDPEVRRYLPPDFRDQFDAEAYRRVLPSRMAVDFGIGLGHWSLWLKEDPGVFVGTALLIPVEGLGPDIEIGWRLPRRFWGQGYAGEAARAVLQHGQAVVGSSGIVALIHPDNAASIGVARKLGFVRSGMRDAYGTCFDLYRPDGENS